MSPVQTTPFSYDKYCDKEPTRLFYQVSWTTRQNSLCFQACWEQPVGGSSSTLEHLQSCLLISQWSTSEEQILGLIWMMIPSLSFLQLRFPVVAPFSSLWLNSRNTEEKQEEQGMVPQKLSTYILPVVFFFFSILKNHPFFSLKLPKFMQLFASVRSPTIGQNDSRQVHLMLTHLLVSKTWTPQEAGCRSPSTGEWCCLLLWWHSLVEALVLSPARSDLQESQAEVNHFCQVPNYSVHTM